MLHQQNSREVRGTTQVGRADVQVIPSETVEVLQVREEPARRGYRCGVDRKDGPQGPSEVTESDAL